MQRRNVLLSTTGAMAVAALGVSKASAQMTRDGSIGPAEYRQATLQLGSFAKQSALMGRQRATHWQIRQFGAFEVDEQTAVAQVLTDEDNPPLAPVSQTEAEMLRNLSRLSGDEFDREFLRGQLMGHQQLLTVQQGLLRHTSTGTDLEHIAVLARMVILQHITMLHDMQNLIPGMIASR